ncbi:hypothetical protein IW140_003097 [Coemansia sp. RSA 1813]|nr:hypothetical protein EV178_003006 [Coemansia sp. RSA 1646]KAJ1769219.1 hypothetical protein LPJ74_004218 [Coemansia sp. RSA 1843]KAJ2089518.1 hypothetical protein IW138_003407 [Coemansia sp. RSA 986]KAJ2214512.1 hypothetical protein EV179_002917 [Coemansia sp. RSA 487]KAJ2569394.1 hypothetical protein IW140_003097 [Coemansia sp. RSA 1813]
MSASVASKYSNLPDIDVDQPDVYETPDVPADDYYDETAEQPLSEDISVSSIAATRAAERFRSSSGDVDGKSALARYQRSLFRTLQLESLSQGGGGDLEVLSTGAMQPMAVKETPEQRLRRLVYETQELEQQLRAASDGNGSGKQTAVALMKLAAGLNNDLAQLSDTVRQSDSGPVSQELWQRLEAAEVEGNEDGTHRKRQVATGVEGVGRLEARIAALEKTLGAGAAHPPRDVSVGHALVDTVSRLRKQIEVLADPHRVDGIQRRVKQALVDMDRLEMASAQAAKAGVSGDSADGKTPALEPFVVKRINEMYDKMVNIDALVELAPATARRLQSLAKLHAQASDVVARISRVESEQQNIGDELGNIKDIAVGLKTSMADNADALKDNMRHLDTRIASLNDRLAALARR